MLPQIFRLFPMVEAGVVATILPSFVTVFEKSDEEESTDDEIAISLDVLLNLLVYCSEKVMMIGVLLLLTLCFVVEVIPRVRWADDATCVGFLARL